MHTECTKMGKTIDTAENCKTCRQAATTDSSDTQTERKWDGEAISGLRYKQYRKLAMAHHQSISAI
jgi:hypothetical protein